MKKIKCSYCDNYNDLSNFSTCDKCKQKVCAACIRRKIGLVGKWLCPDCYIKETKETFDNNHLKL